MPEVPQRFSSPSDRKFTISLLLSLSLLCAVIFFASTLHSQSAAAHPEWPGKGQLFVGTCYQPVDRSPAQIKQDIALMKAAGFKMVRIGDLSWDAIEPSDGVFQFALFDSVMDQMQQADIKVLFDISGLPAPTWLHLKYPSIDLVNQDGATLHPAERYMDNISDPEYRTHVVRMATEVIRHYAHHPALIAFGYDNEIGNGFMSYSPQDRLRFISWLRTKYGTIDSLNAAWATQRWSRHLNSFDEVELPYGDGPGPAERYLDLHRFWSDETIAALADIEAIRRRYAPDVPTASNLWDTAPRKGFDYFKAYKQYTTYGAEGFYPGAPLNAVTGALLTKGDLPTPIWFNEFVTGGSGSYGGPRGSIRMWAYMGLLNYAQTYLAWTFSTHRGGEEQALFGLLDHDGTPSWKYDEFKRIAAEFAQLEHMGFPRYHKPEVAIAYSFDSLIASHPPGPSNSARTYYTTPYREQIDSAFQPFFEANIDAAFINIADDPLGGDSPYKLLIIPGDYVMDEKSAAAIREFVRNGGTAIMTAFSAKVDEHSLWFDTPLPGRLSDVFGIRTSQFYRPEAAPELSFEGKSYKASIHFYEVLEPHTAKTLASFTNLPGNPPAITDNTYGKGHAIYLATPAEPSALAPLIESLYSRVGIEKGPVTPTGVYARVVEGRTLYVNSTAQETIVPIDGSKMGVLSGKHYQNVLQLAPYDVELLQ